MTSKKSKMKLVDDTLFWICTGLLMLFVKRSKAFIPNNETAKHDIVVDHSAHLFASYDEVSGWKVIKYYFLIRLNTKSFKQFIRDLISRVINILKLHSIDPS